MSLRVSKEVHEKIAKARNGFLKYGYSRLPIEPKKNFDNDKKDVVEYGIDLILHLLSDANKKDKTKSGGDD